MFQTPARWHAHPTREVVDSDVVMREPLVHPFFFFFFQRIVHGELARGARERRRAGERQVDRRPSLTVP